MRRAGVLGGMGPEATLVFLEKFYSLTRGRVEQTRPALLVNIDPQVPDRNEAWRGVGISPAASLAAMGRSLRRGGADFCVMACITAHGYVESFEKDVGIPLIRIPDVVADALETGAGPRGPVGLLATTTTLEMNLFQKAFAARNSSLIVPDNVGQAALMRAIYSIKKGEDAHSRVLAIAQSLVARGAHTLLLGCTDLSVLGPMHLERCTVVDALDLLATRTLAEIEKGSERDGAPPARLEAPDDVM
ncbi:MAG TPA: amino acid racemase [Steroidobacteraceae bacterium]|nr:amino acid racemase [Steroidobacteraceae bacterium]